MDKITCYVKQAVEDAIRIGSYNSMRFQAKFGLENW